VLLLGGVASSLGQSNATKSGDQLYLEYVGPLIEKQCLPCHSGNKPQANLNLSTREGLLRGGDRGPAITPGNPKASLLYRLVAREDQPSMPPGQRAPLSKELVTRIAEWIQAGAPYTAGSSQVSGSNTFDRDVRPVFEAKCLGCHGANNVKRAGLDLSTRETLLKGGEDGAAVIPGDPNASLLMKRIRHEIGPGMPFKADKLGDDVIARIADWIKAGAPYSEKALVAAPVSSEATQREKHWAFQPVSRPAIPAVKNTSWVHNPIDAFVAAEHEKRGLKPQPEADKRVLVRRVYLDLIGLPPTPAQVQAFLEDKSAGAYEKVVDQLLADPRYGERWGRHWMDVWRYSDPEGYAGRVDYSQKHIWQWRDWIIESMNQDKGYDRMVTEMLAADELAPTDPKTLRATGYLARSWYRFNRHSWLQDTVDHTAAAFLGISLRCARCHEHKYDPIQQEEYYRFRAFFESYDVRTDPVPGEADQHKKGLPRAYDAEPREAKPDEENAGVLLPAIFGETRRLIRGEETNPDATALNPGVPAALGPAKIEIHAIDMPVEAWFPALKPFAEEDLLNVAKVEIGKAEANLARAERTLANAKERARRPDGGTQRVASSSNGQTEVSGSDKKVSFEKEIRPIFEKNCFACHSAESSKSGLALDTVDSVLAGGNRNGPAAIAGGAEESPLLLYILGEKKPRMPLNGNPLKREGVDLIRKWVEELPQEDPNTVVRKAEVGVLIAQKKLGWVRANLPALQARIAADEAKFHGTAKNVEGLAETARKAERQAHLLKAEANLIQAQQKLSDALTGPEPADEKADKEREKKVAAARAEIDAAQKALSRSTESYTHIGNIYPEHSSGRRTALAKWMVSPENPLAARVAVNHMWLRHLGKALVPTVDNFGVSGARPSHPQLLDWLASEFVQGHWSTKRIHRLIVTSSTYRMQSSPIDSHSPNAAIDPENRYLWRMNSRRMEAEAVRDNIVYLAGQLDTKLGGPDTEDVNSLRRGMYFKQTPYSQTEFLKLFDVANPAECYQRMESVVPQQALALTNSTLSLSMARKLARTLTEKPNVLQGQPSFIRAAFETVLGRPPSDAESAKSAAFLHQQTELLQHTEKLTSLGVSSPGEVPPSSNPEIRARENLVHVLFNHNDFVTVR
jgi:mono/diheme cytochrome c family protein